MEQVGPQLGLEEERQLRAQAFDEARRGTREVQGQEAMDQPAVVAPLGQGANPLGAGGGHGGDGE